MRNSPSSKTCPVCLEVSECKFLRQYHLKDDSYSLFECLKCDVQFWMPFKNPGAEWYEAQEKYRLKEPKLCRGYHKMFLKLYPSFPAGTRVLDIGCGTGELLGELQKRGCDVWGVDSDHRDIELAEKYFGISNLYAVPLESFFQKPDLPLFDLVTFFEVLEHLDNPLKFIQNVKKILRPGGRIIMSVPSRNRMLVNLYDWDFPPYHLSRWNESAIANLFEKINFQIKSINYADENMHFLELFTSLLRKIPPGIRLGKFFGRRPESWIFIRMPATFFYCLGKIFQPITSIRNGVMVVELSPDEQEEHI
jgi:SAM-dependent methyltransferase